MSEDLLQAFGVKKTNSSLENVPISVTGYILPNPGGNETEQSARVTGVRWDTGEKVEVALRSVGNGSRPLIAQFHDDRNSSTPVTTAVGGTLIVEAAYVDSSLTALGGNNVTVLNGRWLNRVSPNQQEGWALRTLARVNQPRFKNANNPADGKTQTITLMAADKAMHVNTMSDLDAAVLNALDSAARDADKKWFNRPGAVNVFVRLSSGTESNLIEMSAGYYQPADKEYSEPKTRNMVQADLANNQFWQQKRSVLEKAMANPNYQVEVIPGSTIFVGRKTMQKNMQSDNGPIKGISRELDGKATSLFTESVIGIRKSPNSGLPQALFVSPFKRNQVASLTGKPNAEESKLFGQELSQNQNITAEQAQATPAQASPAPVNIPTAPTAEVQQPIGQTGTAQQPILPIEVRTNRTDSTKLVVLAKNDKQAQTLQKIASDINVVYEANHRAIVINKNQLPSVLQSAKRDMHEIHIAESKPQINQQPASQPIAASIPPVEESPVIAAEPVSKPEEITSQEPVDLSQLDLSNLDLDSVLSAAYQPTNNQTR
ncbi:hypothetical protein [Cellvibrio sp. QJXJ]|uniref:hypothetical protein n=1 Tax=Cellvibrio sp. QJXJ TaxID=2964606 RepID=UPI0021C39200|nr:hypothetical protein [Cellvibrio sp. QJXJ]UUA75262.1 hypothetical protein NNX04_22670 [Cellvibrio sp. QJXJ]